MPGSQLINLQHFNFCRINKMLLYQNILKKVSAGSGEPEGTEYKYRKNEYQLASIKYP
jgi:hypothetical protein